MGKEVFISCPNCGANDFDESSEGKLLCSLCDTTYIISNLIKNDNQNEELIKSYLSTNRKLKLARNELADFKSSNDLEKELKTIERNQFLEIHQEEKKRGPWGILFSVIFTIVAVGALCSIAYSFDWSIGILIILIFIVLTFRGGLWRKILSLILKDEKGTITSKYSDQATEIKRKYNAKETELIRKVKKYESELETIESKIAAS